jgi:signal transduction histidine kinase
VGTLLYIRLIGFTAGTLLMLFWMVVILGYRRQRNFERVFFFWCLALFLFYSGSLLAINAQIYYSQPPPVLTTFAWTILFIGLLFLPPLLLHLHVEYAETRSLLRDLAMKRVWLAAAYAPALFFGLRAYPILVSGKAFDFLTPSYSLGRVFELWFAVALGVSAYWEERLAREAPDQRQKVFHRLSSGLLGGAGLVFFIRLLGYPTSNQAWLSTALALLPVLPLGALIYYVRRFNFLQIGRQQNLLYAVSVTFFALLYLSLVRRVGIWLEPVLPPEASAAILLFALVVFIEPLQRILGRRLHEAAHREMDLVQRLTTEIQLEARQGNLQALARFTERRVREAFELAAVRVSFWEEREIDEHVREFARKAGLRSPMRGNPAVAFSEGKILETFAYPGINVVGFVRAAPHGSALSGETRAALEFLCEQLPGAVNLCRAVDEKVRLERELAERERMAALGQMAASISHNLKNPLGSIKTILQVQLESPEMPDGLKAETRMVLGEISRLSNKLGQLLQFSRPTVLGASDAIFTLDEVVSEVGAVMRPEAERKGITLQVAAESGLHVMASREAVSDIVSNLVVNGLEAASSGGHVTVSLARRDGQVLICVQDDGKGIPTELREKVMQPFFTTKTQGTGLGLAIVARRVSEAAGKLELQSPVVNARGTRFSIWLPSREEKR